MSLTALCYNWGFFTVLGYAPFPMNLSPIKLGLVFTGWGILVAIFAVFGAPRLQASLGIARTMYANLAAFAVVVLVIAIWTTDRAVLIPAVIVSGIFIGVNNTITTQAVMTVSPVEKPVASAAYSFVRFIGGGLAPVRGRPAGPRASNIHFPFFIAAGAIVAGIVILSTAHGLLGRGRTSPGRAGRRVRPAAPAGPALHPGRGHAPQPADGPRGRHPGRGRRLADRRPGHRGRGPAGGGPAAAWCTWCTPRKTSPRGTSAIDGEEPGRGPGAGQRTSWTGWPRTTSRPRARSCCTRPITAPPAGWSPSTPAPSGPARS